MNKKEELISPETSVELEIFNFKEGSYKDKPEGQKVIKTEIMNYLFEMTELKRNIYYEKLVSEGIFTPEEFKRYIPFDKRYTYSLKELMEADLEDEPLLMGRGFMPTKGYMIVSAPTKSGKTLFSLKLSLHLALGTPFLDIPVMKKSKVLYVYAESGERLMSDTYKKIMRGMREEGIEIDKSIFDNIRFHDAILHKTNFGRSGLLKEFKSMVDKFAPDVVVIDPIGRLTGGLELNDSKNVTFLLDRITAIKKGFWIWVHHNRKRGNEKDEETIEPISKVRGSGSLTDFAETTVCIEPTGKKDPSNFKKLYFYYRRWPSPTIPVKVKWDRSNLNFELMENLEFKRPEKCSVSDLIAFINEEFKGSAPRNDIVDSAHQEFAVTGAHIYEQINKGLAEGSLILKDKKIMVVGSQMRLY